MILKNSLRGIFIKNVSFQTVSQLVSLCAGLVTNAVLSRYLGLEGFGQFTYVFAYYYLFLALNDLGIQTIVIREISQNRRSEGEIIGSILVLKMILSAILCLLSLFVIHTMCFTGELRQALTVYAFILPVVTFQIPQVMFHVLLKLEYASLIGVFNRLFQLALIVCGALLWEVSIPTLFIFLLISEVCSVLLIWFFSRKLERMRLGFSVRWWKHVFTPSLVLGLAGIFAALINRVDYIMLERMRSMAEIGLYSAAYRITNLLETLPLMIMATAFPLMSKMAKEDLVRLKSLYQKLLMGMTIFVIPMAVSVYFLSPWVIRVIFGTAFMDATGVLRILILATSFFYVAVAGGNLLISLGKEMLSLRIQTAALCTNVLLNYFWIPRWGIIGAAYATCLSFAIISSATLICAHIEIKKAKRVTHG